MSVITTHPNYPAYVNADGIWVVGVDFSGPPPGDIENILEDTPTKLVFTTTTGYTITFTGESYWYSPGQYSDTVYSVLEEYPDGDKWYFVQGDPFMTDVNGNIQLGNTTAHSYGIGDEVYIDVSGYNVAVEDDLALPDHLNSSLMLADDDLIRTGQLNDFVVAFEGDDQVTAGAGNDEVWGGPGNDALWGNPGDDVVMGNTGKDVIFGGQGNDVLWGGQDDDIILGNLGDDIIFANLGNDVVFGGQGADYIHGGAGNDTLYGNKDNDTLIGGLGDDKFVFGPDSGKDRIEDYEGAGDALGDEILISSAIMDSDQDVLDAVDEDDQGNAVINLGDGNDITLVGVDSDLISGQDFGFI
ncbi:MAG: calcium-binding protein [Gammaproteobacteria bacterium]|nr:calcium-binding protein [Gammaproteobacteria bacterium]